MPDVEKLTTVKQCDKLLRELRHRWRIYPDDGPERGAIMLQIDSVLEQRIRLSRAERRQRLAARERLTAA